MFLLHRLPGKLTVAPAGLAMAAMAGLPPAVVAEWRTAEPAVLGDGLTHPTVTVTAGHHMHGTVQFGFEFPP
jgi:hypothetical protein